MASMQQALLTGTAVSGDPYWSSVVLLLTMDGTNGGTSWTDLSSYGHAVTNSGTIALSTDQSQFATASLKGIGGNSGYIYASSSPNFDMGGGPWTWECWLYIPSTPTVEHTMFQTYTSGSGSGAYYCIQPTKITFDIRGGLGGFYVALPSIGAWHHIALSTAGSDVNGNINAYVDGVLGVGYSSIIPVQGGDLKIFGDLTQQPSAYMNHLRMTKGVNRYPGGTTFSVPTGSFPTHG